MLNKKFASIRANVKTDKRCFPPQNSKRVNNIPTSNESASRSDSRESRNLEFVDSPLATPVQSRHPYVNLMHQNYFNNASYSPYHLQYQNVSQSTPDMNQSWNVQSPASQVPLVTHFTAAQIYMRPKANASNFDQKTPQSYSPISKRPPPEVPKRTISVASTSTLRKSSEFRYLMQSFYY